jgi:hypothetical protein
MATPKYIRRLQKCVSEINSRDTIVFYSRIASKLLTMSETISDRIEEMKKHMCGKSESGVLLASIEAPVMTIAIKYEYIEYIKQYGPPPEGKFDEDKLIKIRKELGITNVNML